jgi:hypothetical protein
MANDDDYEDREVPMWLDPVSMLQTLVANSPELNVKTALYNVIEYLSEESDEARESGEPRSVSANDLMEVVAQSLAFLHHHVGAEPEPEDDGRPHLHYSGDTPAVPSPTAEELIKRFREQLGETESGEK